MAYGIKRFLILSYCLACCRPAFGARDNLCIVDQWSELEFNFTSQQAKQRALLKGYYEPGVSVPIDLDVQYMKGKQKPRIFVTIPRFDKGRPVTLGTVGLNGVISGYPDYSWHDNQGQNCNGLTSVFRVAIDKCNRLWVMDAGKIGDNQVCPPQLLAFDLSTDQLIYRHKVNASNYIATSLFITPVVDVRGNDPNDCSNTFVYVADVSGFALLVVDVANDRSWRVLHRFMFPYPSSGNFTIAGDSFDLMDGIFGMALSSPYKLGQDRILYFHALASTTENYVRTSVLRNDSFISNPNAEPSSIKVFPDERPNQSAAEAMDNKGILYFGQMEPPSIWCWNSDTKFSKENFFIISKNDETLRFPSGVKIVKNPKQEDELWVLTCNFGKVMTGTISRDKINFRTLCGTTSSLLRQSGIPRISSG